MMPVPGRRLLASRSAAPGGRACSPSSWKVAAVGVVLYPPSPIVTGRRFSLCVRPSLGWTILLAIDQLIVAVSRRASVLCADGDILDSVGVDLCALTLSRSRVVGDGRR